MDNSRNKKMLAIKNDLYKKFLKKRCNETEQCYKKHKNKLPQF